MDQSLLRAIGIGGENNKEIIEDVAVTLISLQQQHLIVHIKYD